MDKLFQIGDLIQTGEQGGEVMEVLEPRALPASTDPVPRYVIRLDNGITVVLYQNALVSVNVNT